MTKSADAFRTISEVAELLDTPAHVLRFWESRFPQIKPVKRAGGRRYYRPADVALLGGIKALLHDDGLTIRGVQKLLKDLGPRHVAAMAEGVEASIDDEGAPESLGQAELRDGPEMHPQDTLPPAALGPTTVEALNAGAPPDAFDAPKPRAMPAADATPEEAADAAFFAPTTTAATAPRTTADAIREAVSARLSANPLDFAPDDGAQAFDAAADHTAAESLDDDLVGEFGDALEDDIAPETTEAQEVAEVVEAPMMIDAQEEPQAAEIIAFNAQSETAAQPDFAPQVSAAEATADESPEPDAAAPDVAAFGATASEANARIAQLDLFGADPLHAAPLPAAPLPAAPKPKPATRAGGKTMAPPSAITAQAKALRALAPDAMRREDLARAAQAMARAQALHQRLKARPTATATTAP